MADSETHQNQSQYAQLETLIQRASTSNGLRALTENELLELGRLYRRAASDLSHARTHGISEAEHSYLNWLVGRAYGLLYIKDSTGWPSIPRFFTMELPQTLRRHWKLIAVSALFFFGTALIAAALQLVRPDLLATLNPQLASTIDDLATRHHGGRNWLTSDMRPFTSSFVMANNIQVSFLAFSGGILACLGTLIVLIQNGIMLGVLCAGVSQTNASVYFWSFILPHGVIELPTIVIAAAAGLLLGRAVIEPGEHSRIDALKLAGREAAVIMLGVAVFLVVAGVVEGMFSPAQGVPLIAKFVVAGLLSTLFWGYIAFAGRRSGARESTVRRSVE